MTDRRKNVRERQIWKTKRKRLCMEDRKEKKKMCMKDRKERKRMYMEDRKERIC